MGRGAQWQCHLGAITRAIMHLDRYPVRILVIIVQRGVLGIAMLHCHLVDEVNHRGIGPRFGLKMSEGELAM